ncbi:MAG: 4-hydroxy-tetrahydrodipicolinate reductase [Rhodanobacteraceae bacterium]
MERTPIDIAVNGAAGRMGRALLRVAHDVPGVNIVAALVRDASGSSASTLVADVSCATTLDANVHPHVLIDFTGPSGFDAALALARERRIGFVCGSTGLAPMQQRMLDDAASAIAVLWSPNFSFGVSALMRAVRDAAARLPGWDCEIIEAHHRGKQDAPSGTALALGRAVADARGQDFDGAMKTGRVEHPTARSPEDIGFAVVRGGNLAGEHMVMFLGEGERIELSHRAVDRDIFARGAIAAAIWLRDQPPGRYEFEQIGSREHARG